MERLQALELKQKSMELADWDENQRLRATVDSQQKVIDYLENKGRLTHGRKVFLSRLDTGDQG